jgi:hypothetical protein
MDSQLASIAQQLLLARLRARNRRDLTADSLERAVQVLRVTCKSWFSASRERDAAGEAAQSGPAPSRLAQPRPKTTQQSP